MSCDCTQNRVSSCERVWGNFLGSVGRRGQRTRAWLDALAGLNHCNAWRFCLGAELYQSSNDLFGLLRRAEHCAFQHQNFAPFNSCSIGSRVCVRLAASPLAWNTSATAH